MFHSLDFFFNYIVCAGRGASFKTIPWNLKSHRVSTVRECEAPTSACHYPRPPCGRLGTRASPRVVGQLWSQLWHRVDETPGLALAGRTRYLLQFHFLPTWVGGRKYVPAPGRMPVFHRRPRTEGAKGAVLQTHPTSALKYSQIYFSLEDLLWE